MPDIALAELAIYYFIAINFLAFAAFGYDKAQAESGGWRVSEQTLVSFVIFGGIVGALAGRALFPHKTRKKSFSEKLWVGFVMNLAGMGGLYYVYGGALEPRDPALDGAMMASAYYPGCNAVRAAGKAPLHYGDPGYRESMDGDGDGVACEDHSSI